MTGSYDYATERSLSDMRYIFHYVTRNLICNKKSSIAAALLYFFAALFFIVQSVFLLGWSDGNRIRIENTYGVHDGIFAVQNPDKLKGLSEITDSGVITVIGSGIKSEEYSGRQITVGYADSNAVLLNRIALQEGNFPDNKSEIAIERSFLNLVYPDAKLGDKIGFYLNEEYTELTLCGILNNISSLQWDGLPPMINALVHNTFSENTAYCFVSVSFADGTDISGYSEKLLENGTAGAFCPNKSSADLSVISGISNISSVAVLCVIMFVFTVIILFSVTAVSVRGSSKQIGRLKIIGFSGRAIYGIFLTKTAILSLLSSILGGIAAFPLSFVIYGSFSAEISAGQTALLCIAGVFGIFVFSMLFGVVGIRKTADMTVIECLRPVQKEINTPNRAFSCKNPYILYSVKSFAQNSGTAVCASIAAFISIVAIVLGLYIGEALKTEISSYMRPYDFQINFNTSNMLQALTVNSDSLDGLSKTDYSALCENPDTADMIGMATMEAYSLTTEPVADYDSEEAKQELMAMASAAGYPEGYYLANELLCGVSDSTLSTLNDYVIKGKIDIDALKNGTQIITSGDKYAPGDKIRLAAVINDVNKQGEDAKRMLDFEVKVGAVLDLSTGENSLMKQLLYGYIWSIDAYSALGLDASYNRVYLTVKDKDNYSLIAGVLNDIYSHYKAQGMYLSITDVIQQTSSAQQVYDSFVTVSRIFCFTLCGFSIIALIGSLYGRLWGRKQIFGMLRAVGMTKNQMLKLLLCENLTGIGIAVILGIVISGGACVAFGILSNAPITMFPITDVAVLVLIYSAAVCLTCLTATNKFFKTTVAENVRGYE